MGQIVQGGAGGAAGQVRVVVGGHQGHGEVLEELQGLARVGGGVGHLHVEDVAVLHVARSQQLVHSLSQQLHLLGVLHELVQLRQGGDARLRVLVEDLGDHQVQSLVRLWHVGKRTLAAARRIVFAGGRRRVVVLLRWLLLSPAPGQGLWEGNRVLVEDIVQLVVDQPDAGVAQVVHRRLDLVKVEGECAGHGTGKARRRPAHAQSAAGRGRGPV